MPSNNRLEHDCAWLVIMMIIIIIVIIIKIYIFLPLYGRNLIGGASKLLVRPVSYCLMYAFLILFVKNLVNYDQYRKSFVAAARI